MKRRCLLVLMLFYGSFTSRGLAQHVKLSVDCATTRLDGAERATCTSPDLMRLSTSVDSATQQLETSLSGRDRDALFDSERPVVVERNNCQNAPVVHACVERVLERRLTGLAAASRSPRAMLDEAGRAAFVDVAYLRKWGELMIGKRVHVWGCMVLEPGSAPTARTRGFVSDSGSKAAGEHVPVFFTSMNDEQASFFDTQLPVSWWEGVVERRQGMPVLAGVSPIPTGAWIPRC